MIDGLGECVYFGHKPPKHSDVEYMVDILEVFLNEKVEIKWVRYDRDGSGLWAWLKKENGEEMEVSLKGTTLKIGNEEFDTEKYGFWEIRKVLEQWLNQTK